MPIESRETTEKRWQVARQELLENYSPWLNNYQTRTQKTIKMEDTSGEPCTATDAPIALRRPKRKSSVISPVKQRAVSDSTAITKTPSTRNSKRVRFSDPGLLSASRSTSTSLTPALNRASLGTPSRRRPATPGPQVSGNIQFTPLTQRLDERSQRRIRRNGLSEEMNNYETEKKTKAALQKEIEAKDKELRRLREELEETKVSIIQPSPDATILSSSQQRVQLVEAELEALRQSFAIEESQPIQSWDHVPRASSALGSEGGDTIMIWEGDDEIQRVSQNASANAEAMVMGLELQAARQAKTNFLGSFRDAATSCDFTFADTPVKPTSTVTARLPETPNSFFQDISKQLKATTNRAEEAELALAVLEEEVRALGFGEGDEDISTVVTTISNHFRQARLELERAVPGETVAAFENPKVLPELVLKLKLLAERLRSKESELSSARGQHRSLRGNFEKAIIAAEKANERVKKLEAALDSTAEESLELRMRSQRLERDVSEKEKDIQSLTVALGKYRDDVGRLESLIGQLEHDYKSKDITAAQVSELREQKIDELEAKVAAEEHGRRAAEVSAVSRLGKINELENALALTKRQAADVEATLSDLQTSVAQTSSSKEEQIGSLNTRIASLATALTSANAEVEKLKITKSKLEQRVKEEVAQGETAVQSLQDQLLRTLARTVETRKSYFRGAKVRIANWELAEEASSDGVDSDAAPMTPASMVRFAEYAEVQNASDGDDEDMDTDKGTNADDDELSLPSSVRIERGRGSLGRQHSLSRRGSKTLKTSTSQSYDGANTMSSPTESHIERKFHETRRDSGIGGCSLMTPEQSSDVELPA